MKIVTDIKRIVFSTLFVTWASKPREIYHAADAEGCFAEAEAAAKAAEEIKAAAAVLAAVVAENRIHQDAVSNRAWKWRELGSAGAKFSKENPDMHEVTRAALMANIAAEYEDLLPYTKRDLNTVGAQETVAGHVMDRLAQGKGVSKLEQVLNVIAPDASGVLLEQLRAFERVHVPTRNMDTIADSVAPGMAHQPA